MSSSPDSKRCTKCGKTKQLDAFWKQKGRKDGHHSWCADCRKAGKHNQNPAARDRAAALSRAYQRALYRLRDAHGPEFKALLAKAKEAEGL